ncbi:hypothetical protein C8R47DRAFT_128781 [Mycena vitilis]|nr:hypothetical protein C8R47DRAFT_128781 [Mycena vitilis]
MFAHSTGHHIQGGIFYSVGGDVKLQRHQNLTLGDSRLSSGSSPWGLAEGQTAGSTKHRECPLDVQVQSLAKTTSPSEDGHAQGSEREWKQYFPRYSHEDMAARSTTYDPVDGGTFINAQTVKVYGPERRREDNKPTHTATRLDERDGIKIVRVKHLALSSEIGSGPGYLIHAGWYKSHAVVVKVFNQSPSVRQQVEATAALSKGIMHPNVLRIEGVSSPTSPTHFITYQSASLKGADGPLAVALKNDLGRSIELGFRTMAGISAGMNHLCVQGVCLGSIGIENFDVFLDQDDRLLMSFNPRFPGENDPETQDDIWIFFNMLCQKVLTSANHVLHKEEINRDPAIGSDSSHPGSGPAGPLSHMSTSGDSERSPPAEQELDGVTPRREYVWRTIARGRQSLESVGRRIMHDLDLHISPLHRLTRRDERNAHRCAGYIREEITLATTTIDSAIVAHDTLSPLEICSVCHEVVGLDEGFRCICGNSSPGSEHTIKCQVCKLWSHTKCVGNSKVFSCQSCLQPANRYPRGPGQYRATLNDTVGDAWGRLIGYSESRTRGPRNSQQWNAIAYIDGIECGRGSGSTKASARESAARKALVAVGIPT